MNSVWFHVHILHWWDVTVQYRQLHAQFQDLLSMSDEERRLDPNVLSMNIFLRSYILNYYFQTGFDRCRWEAYDAKWISRTILDFTVDEAKASNIEHIHNNWPPTMLVYFVQYCRWQAIIYYTCLPTFDVFRCALNILILFGVVLSPKHQTNILR